MRTKKNPPMPKAKYRVGELVVYVRNGHEFIAVITEASYSALNNSWKYEISLKLYSKSPEDEVISFRGYSHEDFTWVHNDKVQLKKLTEAPKLRKLLMDSIEVTEGTILADYSDMENSAIEKVLNDHIESPPYDKLPKLDEVIIVILPTQRFIGRAHNCGGEIGFNGKPLIELGDKWRYPTQNEHDAYFEYLKKHYREDSYNCFEYKSVMTNIKSH